MKYLIIILFSFNTPASTSFIEKVSKILENDPSFLEIKNQFEFNESNELSAKTKLFLPNIYLTHSRERDESLGSSQEISSTRSRLTATYSVFSFGSDYKNYNSKKHSLKAYKANLNQKLITRERVIIQLLLNNLKLDKSVSIQQEIISLKEKSFKISTQKFKKGSLSRNDLTRLKIDLFNTKSELVNIKQEVLINTAEIKAYGVDGKIKDFPWLPIFKKSGLNKVLELKSENSKNPTLLKFQYLMLSQEQAAQSSARKHLGRVSLNYSRDLYTPEDSDDLYGWSASIIYTLPLFENYDQEKQIQQARANANTAKALYVYNKNLIESFSQTKVDILKLNYEDFKSRQDNQNDSDKLFMQMISRFKKGTLSVNDLFLEQDRLLRTRKLTNQSIYNLHVSYMDLIHSYGLAITMNQNLF